MYQILNQIGLAVKISWRQFQKNWIYGSLNLAGLAIAFSTLMFVIIYVHQETTYESFHQQADRIYRPTYHITTASNFEASWARVPVNYINLLPEEFPEIEHLIRFQNQEQRYLRIGNQRFKPTHAYITDPEVFDVFNLSLIAGDPQQALARPNSIVLSESTARTYFSRLDVLGEEIAVVGDWTPEEEIYEVTGIMRDLPGNTHLPINLLFSFPNEEARSGWAYVYTLLSPNANISDVESKMSSFVEKNVDPESTTKVSYEFQALPDIHLHSHLAREIVPNGQVLYVKIFFWVGLLVWIIALINFTNLSSALALNREKEVGIRKIMGASGRNLTFFTMVDSITYSLGALMLSAILTYVLYPFYVQLTDITLLPSLPYFFAFMVGVAIFSGFLAGIFPSALFASMQGLSLIKARHFSSPVGGRNSINPKRIMIGIQFCATLILLASASIASRQFMYINHKNLGLESDQILTITQVPDQVTRKYKLLKERLQNIPGVVEITACMQVPSSEIRDVGPVLVKGVNDDADLAPMMDMQIIDPDFIDVMDLQLLSGKDFRNGISMGNVPEFSDSLTANDYLANQPRQYYINETAMKQLGWSDPELALEHEINWSIGSFELAFGPIKGVVKDFHQETLKNQVDPTVMVVEPLWLQNLLIKVETKELNKTITGIEGVWNELFPYPFAYSFLDELFNQLYMQDRIQLKLLMILSVIAIFISLTGLISLVAFTLKRRSKELAIRRVIGANLYSLTMLIGKEYMWLLIIASALGIPLSYQWISKWLQNFAYRIDVPYIFFGGVVLFLLTLIFTAIYWQTFKATTGNPTGPLKED